MTPYAFGVDSVALVWMVVAHLLFLVLPTLIAVYFVRRDLERQGRIVMTSRPAATTPKATEIRPKKVSKQVPKRAA